MAAGLGDKVSAFCEGAPSLLTVDCCRAHPATEAAAEAAVPAGECSPTAAGAVPCCCPTRGPSPASLQARFHSREGWQLSLPPPPLALPLRRSLRRPALLTRCTAHGCWQPTTLCRPFVPPSFDLPPLLLSAGLHLLGGQRASQSQTTSAPFPPLTPIPPCTSLPASLPLARRSASTGKATRLSSLIPHPSSFLAGLLLLGGQ